MTMNGKLACIKTSNEDQTFRTQPHDQGSCIFEPDIWHDETVGIVCGRHSLQYLGSGNLGSRCLRPSLQEPSARVHGRPLGVRWLLMDREIKLRPLGLL